MKSSKYFANARNAYSNKSASSADSIKAAYPSEDIQPAAEVTERGANLKELIQQRDEALKKEEAALDRLKLKEDIFSKQINELRTQVKKLTSENQKLQKAAASTFSSRNDRKSKEGKGQVRQLNKTIELLKCEKKILEEKARELSEFTQIAINLKQNAVKQCSEKDQIIFNLRKESVWAHQMKETAVNHQSRLEAELRAIQTYVDFMRQKRDERMRTKSVQTDTSIPVVVSTSNVKVKSPLNNTTFSAGKPAGQSKAYSNYRAMETAASLLKTKIMEQEFQKQTEMMKTRFTATTNDAELRKTAAAKISGFMKVSPVGAQRRFSCPSEELQLGELDKSLSDKDEYDPLALYANQAPPRSSPPKVVRLIKPNLPSSTTHAATLYG